MAYFDNTSKNSLSRHRPENLHLKNENSFLRSLTLIADLFGADGWIIDTEISKGDL